MEVHSAETPGSGGWVKIEEGAGFQEEVPPGLNLEGWKQASITHMRQKGVPDRGVDAGTKRIFPGNPQFGLVAGHGVPEPPAAGHEAGQRQGLACCAKKLGLFLRSDGGSLHLFEVIPATW